MNTATNPIQRRLGALLLTVLALGLAGAAETQAQTAEDALRFTERSPATGARMIGMAGAGIAGVADYGAFFTNPAGLAYFRSSSAAGALNTVFTVDEGFYSTPGFSSTLDEDVAATNLGNLAYLYRAPTRQGSLVLGAAFNQVNTFERDLRFSGTNATSTISTSFLPFDGEFELDGDGDLVALDDLPFAAFNGGLIEFFPEFLDEDPNAYPFLEAVVPGSRIQQQGSVVEQGRMSEASFGGAVEAARDVMVGASVNLAFGTYDFLSTFEEIDIFDENGPDDYSVIDGENLLEGFDALTYRQRLETDLVGINLRTGVSARVAPSVRIGATLETPTYYSIDEEFGQDFVTRFDDGGILRYGEGFDDVTEGVFEYTLRTPWRFGLGAGFAAAGLSVLLDAEFVDWGQLELDADVDRAFFDDLNLQIEEDYEPVVNTRLGLEYRTSGLVLRGGVAYQPDPLDRALLRPDGSELDRDKVFISAGVGYRFDNRFQLDFGWMQGRFDGLYSAYPEDSVGPRQDDVLVIDEEVIQNQFVIGMSVSF